MLQTVTCSKRSKARSKRSRRMGKARKTKPTSSREETTTPARSPYDAGVDARKAQNQAVLDALELGGQTEPERPAQKAAAKRRAPMPHATLGGSFERSYSTASVCRKATDAPTPAEPARRSGRRATAPRLEESAVLTAASGAEPTGPRVYTFDPYLLGGTPFTTSVPCPVLKKNVAIGVFVRTRGHEIEVDFGQRTYSFSKAAAERGRVTDADDAARFHAMWLSNKLGCADLADGIADDSDGDGRSAEGNGVRGASETATGSTPNATAARVGATAIRPVLPIAFRCLVPVPINTKEGVRLWLAAEGVEPTVRKWVLATMRGRGLERRVETGEVDRAGHAVRDAMNVTTEALVGELLTALRPCVWADGRCASRELLDSKHLRKGLQTVVSQARSARLSALRRTGAHAKPFAASLPSTCWVPCSCVVHVTSQAVFYPD